MLNCHRKPFLLAIAGVIFAVLVAGGPAFAQAPAAPPAQPGGAPGGGQGGFDPKQFRQMMMDRLKEKMGATDDEWKILQPRVQKLMDAQRDANAGLSGMGALFGFGGGRNRVPTADTELSPTAKAAQELQAAVQDEKTDPKELTRLMTAFREAQEKARQQLAQDRKDVKELLTAKQEAVLLSIGLLD